MTSFVFGLPWTAVRSPSFSISAVRCPASLLCSPCALYHAPRLSVPRVIWLRNGLAISGYRMVSSGEAPSQGGGGVCLVACLFAQLMCPARGLNVCMNETNLVLYRAYELRRFMTEKSYPGFLSLTSSPVVSSIRYSMVFRHLLPGIFPHTLGGIFEGRCSRVCTATKPPIKTSRTRNDFQDIPGRMIR